MFLAGCTVPSAAPPAGPATAAEPTALPATVDAAPAMRGANRGGQEIAALLAPFEDAEHMPPLLAALPFEPGRAYAIVVHLPAPAVVDMSTPNRARQGLAGLLDPFARLRAGTGIGHAMIGWRCADGRQGLVSKTGSQGNQGMRMLLSGWGLSTLLAEYGDGDLYALADLPPSYVALEQRSATRIAAFEIAPEGCQNIRRALADYITHPDAPAQRYTMVPDPALMEGAGCGTFALWLAGHAGVFEGVEAAMHRDVPLADSYIGVGRSLPEGVRPWLPPGVAPEELNPLPLPSLLRADWNDGADLGSLRLMDMELLLLSLDRAQARAGIVRPPRLRADDPAVARLRAAADGWLNRYGRVTPVRMGRAQAVVMHRR